MMMITIIGVTLLGMELLLTQGNITLGWTLQSTVRKTHKWIPEKMIAWLRLFEVRVWYKWHSHSQWTLGHVSFIQISCFHSRYHSIFNNLLHGLAYHCPMTDRYFHIRYSFNNYSQDKNPSGEITTCQSDCYVTL